MNTTRKTLGGFSLVEMLISIGLLALVVVIGIVLIGNERARTRDSRRIADMTRVQAAFQILFFEKAGFSDAAQGCAKIGDEVNACGLGRYLVGIGTVRDPGKGGYTIAKVPDAEDYSVEFTLERSYGNLKAGVHHLTKAGIR
jgi:type II secretory pathway pseudopilin PulG